MCRPVWLRRHVQVVGVVLTVPTGVEYRMSCGVCPCEIVNCSHFISPLSASPQGGVTFAVSGLSIAVEAWAGKAVVVFTSVSIQTKHVLPSITAAAVPPPSRPPLLASRRNSARRSSPFLLSSTATFTAAEMQRKGKKMAWPRLSLHQICEECLGPV